MSSVSHSTCLDPPPHVAVCGLKGPRRDCRCPSSDSPLYRININGRRGTEVTVSARALVVRFASPRLPLTGVSLCDDRLSRWTCISSRRLLQPRDSPLPIYPMRNGATLWKFKFLLNAFHSLQSNGETRNSYQLWTFVSCNHRNMYSFITFYELFCNEMHSISNPLSAM